MANKPKKWEFLEGKEVYLYPSSNADDGGDVNSEKNLSEISRKFTSRNFVIKRSKDDEPLKVIGIGNQINISDGEAVVEGYYISIKSKGEGSHTTFSVDDSHIPESELIKFINDYKTRFRQLYKVTGTTPVVDEYGNWVYRDDVSKKFREENPLPKLHVVLKLLQNTTGNLRGDITERTLDSPNLTYRVCKGLALSVCTDEELSELDSLYLDLAWIYPEPFKSTSSYILINHIVNDNSRYTYIDEDSIITEDGLTIREWVQKYVSERLDELDHLTHKITEDDVTWTDSVLYTNNDDSGVVRFDLSQPVRYDENGNPHVTPDTGFDRTYSFDRIQERTHPVSRSRPSSISSTEDPTISTIAPQVDPRDNGQGTIETFQATGDTIHKVTRNTNGVSKLVARGDHTHDGRYIYTKDATADPDQTQTIGTNLKVEGYQEVDGDQTVQGDEVVHGHLMANDGASIEGDTSISGGNLAVAGNITGSKVYNAVWNDYADFLPKSKDSEYEPGDLISKKRGVNEYVPSSHTEGNADLVVGVFSDTYGVLLGGDRGKSEKENKENYIPVAVAGNVYAKVVGKVKEGDFIGVSSIPGVGVSVSKFDQRFIGTIVGKSLQDKNSEGIERILIQVMLR